MSDNPELKTKSSRTKRLITGTVLSVMLSLLLYLRGWYFATVAFLAVCATIHEEMSALRAGGHRPVSWASYAALCVGLPLMMFYSSLSIIPVLALMGFAVVLHVMRRQEPELTDILVSVLPMLTLVLPGMCLIGLLDTRPDCLQALMLVQVFVIAVGGDTFAYFVGSAVGGPKLCPRISPNKTVAGAVGGLLGSVLCAVLVGRIFAWSNPDFRFPPLWADLLLGVFGGFAAQMGDLFASMVKRHCNIKDFGTIFPGHGGMLDRMDSILFACIIVYSYRAIVVALPL